MNKKENKIKKPAADQEVVDQAQAMLQAAQDALDKALESQKLAAEALEEAVREEGEAAV